MVTPGRGVIELMVSRGSKGGLIDISLIKSRQYFLDSFSVIVELGISDHAHVTCFLYPPDIGGLIVEPEVSDHAPIICFPLDIRGLRFRFI